jgi:hypothetical protein
MPWVCFGMGWACFGCALGWFGAAVCIYCLLCGGKPTKKNLVKPLCF